MNDVLYVEDSTTSQILMRRYLEGIASLTIASSLDAAILLLRERRFKLMISRLQFSRGQFPAAHPVRSHVADASPDAGDRHQQFHGWADAGPDPEGWRQRRPGEASPYCGVSGAGHADAVRALCSQSRASGDRRHLFPVAVTPGVHEFCPELNLMVTGATREEAVDRMRAALQQHGARLRCPWATSAMSSSSGTWSTPARRSPRPAGSDHASRGRRASAPRVIPPPA